MSSAEGAGEGSMQLGGAQEVGGRDSLLESGTHHTTRSPTRRGGPDAVKYISAYISASGIKNCSSPAERNQQLADWLLEYHASTDQQRRAHLRECVLFTVFYLFPYILRDKRMRANSFDDSIQNIISEVLVAIDKFDPTRGTKFTAYISGYMKAGVNRTFQDSTIVKQPASVRRKHLEALRELEEGEGETPPVESKSPPSCGCQAWGTADDAARYDANQYYEQAGLVTDKDQILEDVHSSRMMAVLEDVLSSGNKLLQDKAKVVLTYRFGVFGAPQLTLQEVADLFIARGWRASKESIFQIEGKAKAKLREYFIRLGYA